MGCGGLSTTVLDATVLKKDFKCIFAVQLTLCAIRWPISANLGVTNFYFGKGKQEEHFEGINKLTHIVLASV